MDTSRSHTVAIVSIYRIIMRNTSIIHIINYSSLQVMRPKYYWRHWTYTSDWAIYIKNPCARRLFIPLLVEINTENSPFLAENDQNIQKLKSENFWKWFLFLEWCLIKNVCRSIVATHKKWPSDITFRKVQCGVFSPQNTDMSTPSTPQPLPIRLKIR